MSTGIERELAEALIAAVEHLNYTGWGDSWERETISDSRRSIEDAAEKAQWIVADPIAEPDFVCDRCGREFADRSGLRGHRKHSQKCRRGTA